MNEDPKALGTENIRWDLARIYAGIDDPAVQADIERIAALCDGFHAQFKGQLATALGDAIEAYRAIEELTNKLFIWFHLMKAVDVKDQKLKTVLSKIHMRLDPIMAERLTFFDHEIIALSDEQIAAQASHPAVAKHMPWIVQTRTYKPYLLAENVE